jgi:formylmethanofuran dehydrogenase subunit E
MPEPPEIFARIYARHGHRCPMSTLGGRLGLALVKRLGDRSGRVSASYGSRTCALDGIAEVTGLSEEAGTLTVSSEGRHALRVEAGGELFTLELTATALKMAGRYRALCERLERNGEALDGVEQERRRARLDAMLDQLLPQLWAAPDELLVQPQGQQPDHA